MNADVLFIDDNHVISRMAEAIAKDFAPEGVRVESAGLEPVSSSSQLENLLHEFSIEWYSPVMIDQIGQNKYDLIVNLCTGEIKKGLLFPGAPPVIRWDILQPDMFSIESCRAAFNALKNLIADLFKRGFFDAFLQQRTYLHDVLDSLSEGIIAHGLDRKIFFFSKGAEKITGVKKEQVLGHDCHELFAPHFCGNQCVFCDTNADFSRLSSGTFTAIFTAKDSSRKEFDVTRVPLRNEYGEIIGTIATINDSTRVRQLESRLEVVESFSGIIGQDHKMIEIFEFIKDIAQSDFPVVISGESGTGKELVAAAVHKESNRRDRLFVPVNCGALPEGTLESELFGHVKGAFTGAIRDKKGRFELADKGTLFLDEIGELSLRMQVKLLRILQEGVFESVGSEISKKIDVRILCATNRNLKEMVASGAFREDLYYRLAVVPIEIPPLRERRNDIALLAQHFLQKNIAKLSRNAISFSEEAISYLMGYQWPGNVRQLQNAIQFALIKCRGNIIFAEHLPPEIVSVSFVSTPLPHTPGKAGRKLKLTIEVVERALAKAGGNKAKASRLLGVGRATLYNFININRNILEGV